MTRKRHTEEQIIAVLKDAQAGIGVAELCRRHGISDATFHKWRTKYAGLEVSDGCAGSWPSIAIRSGIAGDAMRMRRCGPGSGRLPSRSGGMAVPGSMCAYGGRAGA